MNSGALRIIVFLILTYLALMVVARLFDARFNNQPIAGKTNWTLSKSGGDYDYALIGSSDVLHDINTKTVEKLTGKKGINIGQQGTCMAEMLAVFEKFISNNNRVKHIYLQTDLEHLSPENSFKVHYQYYLPFMNQPVFDALLRENTKTTKYLAWKYIPFFKYAEYNNLYSLKALVHKQNYAQYRQFDSLNGSEMLKETSGVFSEPSISNPVLCVDPYLYKIIDYAQKKNMKITLMSLPRYYTVFQYQLNRKRMLDMIDSICTSNKLEYINFASEKFAMNYNKKMFYDHSHLNAEGALKFSQLLSDSLLKYKI